MDMYHSLGYYRIGSNHPNTHWKWKKPTKKTEVDNPYKVGKPPQHDWRNPTFLNTKARIQIPQKFWTFRLDFDDLSMWLCSVRRGRMNLPQPTCKPKESAFSGLNPSGWPWIPGSEILSQSRKFVEAGFGWPPYCQAIFLFLLTISIPMQVRMLGEGERAGDSRSLCESTVWDPHCSVTESSGSSLLQRRNRL